MSVVPNVSSPLSQYTAGLGISDLGAGYVDEDDPDITVGFDEVIDPGDEYAFVNGRGPELQRAPKRAKASELVNELFRSDDKKIRDIQSKLVRAGLLESKEITPGRPDPQTVKAYRAALVHAGDWNKADPNTTFDEMLTEMSVTRQEQGNAFAVTNPEDILATAKDVSLKLLGRQMSDNDLMKFVTAFQESQLQTQMNAAGQEDLLAQGQDVAVTKAPTEQGLQKILSDQIRSDNPQEASATDFANNAAEFQNLLRESSRRVKSY